MVAFELHAASEHHHRETTPDGDHSRHERLNYLSLHGGVSTDRHPPHQHHHNLAGKADEHLPNLQLVDSAQPSPAASAIGALSDAPAPIQAAATAVAVDGSPTTTQAGEASVAKNTNAGESSPTPTTPAIDASTAISSPAIVTASAGTTNGTNFQATATDATPVLPSGVSLGAQTFNSNFSTQGLSQFTNGQLVGGQTTLAGNGELETYTAANTVLQTINDPVTGNPITVANEFVTPNGDGTFNSGAIISTNPIGGSDNGYYQATMKLSSTADTWPAVWSSNGREIDALEALSSGQSDGEFSEPSGSIHNGVIDWANGGTGGGGWTNVSNILASEPAVANGDSETLQNSFHSYGVQVNGNNLTYYFDGQKVNSATDTLGSEGPAQWMINTAVGGNWSGDANVNNGPFGPSNGTQIESLTAYNLNS